MFAVYVLLICARSPPTCSQNFVGVANSISYWTNQAHSQTTQLDLPQLCKVAHPVDWMMAWINPSSPRLPEPSTRSGPHHIRRADSSRLSVYCDTGSAGPIEGSGARAPRGVSCSVSPMKGRGVTDVRGMGAAFRCAPQGARPPWRPAPSTVSSMPLCRVLVQPKEVSREQA